MLIARALGVAAVKAVICVTGIIIAGRTLLRPVFRRINSIDNDELFAATTLLVVLGSSVLTQIAGLSQALGAFLAGLLMAETEYALQVRSLSHSPCTCNMDARHAITSKLVASTKDRLGSAP